MHDIEQFADGSAAFVSAREDAWHRLGTVTDHALTAAEAMDLAFLRGWNVRKVPLITGFADDGADAMLAVPGKYASVRTHPKTGAADVLGVVGEDYTPVQNEQHCDILDTVVDESGAHFETAGSLGNGRQVFVTMKLPRTITVGGSDRTDLYIAAANSHDGSKAFTLMVTPVRVVCANTLHAALGRAKSKFSIRHTSGAQGRIDDARRALGLVFAYADAFEAEAEKMINETLSMDAFRKVCDEIWAPPVPSDSVRTVNNYQRRAAHLKYLYAQAPTQAGIRGTRWAGYQAITEYLDHYAPAPSAEARATRVLTSGDVAAMKDKAFSLLSV